MRYVLAIWFLLIQLAGYYSVEAKALSAGLQKENAGIEASSIHQHHDAEIAAPLHGKIRAQRLGTGLICLNEFNRFVPGQLCTITNTYSPSSYHRSLIRLLLFPNHYFW